MKTNNLILVSLLLIAGAFLLTAQDTESKVPTIEELFLGNPAVIIVKEKADSEDRDLKLEAVVDIQEMLKSGSSSDDEAQLVMILGDLAGEGILARRYRNGALINYYPIVRQKACGALGEMTSQSGKASAKDILIQVLLTDNEPIVLAEAAKALGNLGLNEDNEVANVIAYIMIRQDIIAPDNLLAYSFLLAIEKLAQANDGITEPEVYKAVFRISQGNYVTLVKDKAQETLKELRGY